MKARACGAACIQKNYILFKEEFRYGTHQITWRVNRYRRIRAETGFNPHHFLALITTGIVGGLGVGGLLETIGTNFVANRSMAIFMMILLVTGTLERNGLREAAANLIKKVKSATAGKLIAVYGVLNGLFGAFNVGFGGVAGFIRPVLLPMAEGAIENKEGTVNEEHLEEVKGLAAAMQNFTWFFFQVLFVGGAGGILVQTTLAGLGYEVSLIDLAAVEIPVALFSLVVSCVYVIVKDNRISKKYYEKSAGKKTQK